MDTQWIRKNIDRGVATITLDRPQRRNALSPALITQLLESVDAAVNDAGAQVIVLNANGPVFCAGMDLKEVHLDREDEAADFAHRLGTLYLRLLRLEKPLLCAVDGPTLGGGLGLVAAADEVWAGPTTRLALPEVRLGLLPALVSVVLRRRLAPRQLAGLALTGESVDVNGALRLGLVDRVTEGRAAPLVQAHAEELAAENSSSAMNRTRAFLSIVSLAQVEDELEEAQRQFCEAAANPEVRRGLEAFRDRERLRRGKARDGAS
jgi:methylglutaconyl-CoA hydratase